MQIQSISNHYRVEYVNEAYLDQVFELCLSNPQYYGYTKTVLTLASIKEDLFSLPPNKTLEDKYFLGFYEANQLVAIVDLIKDFPNPHTAYIGLFMTHKKVQGKGIGSHIIQELERFLILEGFEYIQLAFIIENIEAREFWLKNGYEIAGEPIQTDTYKAVPVKKKLN